MRHQHGKIQYNIKFKVCSCFGEGNGIPLQCSCLENPRDGVAWWAAVSGVAQSRTRLKRLSSSSSSMLLFAPWKPHRQMTYVTMTSPGSFYRQ